jgi:hypothetical protein
MFEKEIIAISDNSLNKIKKLGAYFTIEQLNATELHPAITRYIDSELNYLIFLDRKELVQKSAFDYSNPEVVKYFSLINSEIKKNKKISFEDAKNLIIQAVSFTANFLVRPKWSLTKFIYNEDQLKTIDEIRLSLNYLYYYDYLRKVLITFIEKKRSLNFSLIDFEVALNKIDKELFVRQSQNLIDNALFSIADFFSLSGTAANKVSPNSIELFLKEKDLIDQLFRLRRALPANARQYYTLNEIRHIIHTPTSLDKSERLPSKTDEEEELKFETPVETKTDESKPEVKSEKKEEIIQEEIFNFENETEEKEVDNEQEKVAELNDEITLQQNIIPEEHDKVEEKQSEVKEEPDEVSEKPDEVSEEIENLDDANNNLDEMKEEESGNDLDSILEEDLLNDYSTDDELLDAFDSQLKALEEESDILLTNDEKSSNVNDSQGEEKEEESDKVEEETEKKVQPKIELETEEQIEVEEEITEPQISLNEEVEKIEDEKPVIEESPKEVKKEKKKTYRHAPQKSKDIFSFLSNKEIEKIVINVFNEDREDFANTMEKITECFSYDEATDILKAVFFSYRVNPYTKDAVILTNAVSNYFNQAT